MFVSQLQSNINGLQVSVHKGNEPIRIGLGTYSEIGINVTREEALELYSQLEKAIHLTA